MNTYVVVPNKVTSEEDIKQQSFKFQHQVSITKMNR